MADAAEQYYNTVDSQKSMMSVDNILESLPHGEIEFVDGIQRHRRVCIRAGNRSTGDNETAADLMFPYSKSVYVRVPVDVDIESLVRFMAIKWMRKSPKIILQVATGLSHFKPWKNEKQLNKFKRGIIKVEARLSLTADITFLLF